MGTVLWGLVVVPSHSQHPNFECTDHTPVSRPLTSLSTEEPVPTLRARGLEPPPRPPSSLTIFRVLAIRSLWRRKIPNKDTGPRDLQIFSPVLWIMFSLTWWCPLKHKNFDFSEVPFIYFSLAIVLLVSCLKKPLPNPKLQRFTFSLAFRSVTHFELIFLLNFVILFKNIKVVIWKM